MWSDRCIDVALQIVGPAIVQDSREGSVKSSCNHRAGEVTTVTIHITFSHSPNLQDQERLQTLVNMAATNMAMSIANAGHSFAMAASARDLSPAAHLSELFGGITQV